MKNNNLKKVYNTVAKKYYHSRKKYWSDWPVVLKEIKSCWKKEISILEFWCGWWRCIKFLNENLKWIKINYTWVDISNKLLWFAKKDNPQNTFVCDDILKYISTTKQESFDFIIWIASFQHIKKNKQRLFLMKNFYKSLKYWWKLIMTNRSYSKRFIKKYKKSIFLSILKTIYTLWIYNSRDLYIPRSTETKKLYRFYHMFSKKELFGLCRDSWFSIQKLSYLDKKWQETSNWKLSNNTILIWKKTHTSKKNTSTNKNWQK